MRKVILGLLAALFSTAALAQAVQQSGSVTQRHFTCWTTAGVVQDCGTAASGFATSLGVTASGAGICQNSDRTTAVGYQQVCMGATTAGGGFFSVQNYGTAVAQPLSFLINGVPSTFPTISGNPALNHIATFVGSGVIGDSGLAASSSVVTTGSWGATPIAIAFGGTGATTVGTARTNLGLGTLAQQDANAVNITGATLVSGLPTPLSGSDAATKSYVDSVATGLNVLPASTLATAAALPNSPTYSNGASGVGATLTAGSNTTLTVDGTAAPLNTVVLVNNQVSAFQNGIYTVTTAGSGAAAWVLTRATYFDQAAEMVHGSYTFISSGATLSNTSYTLQTTVTTVGTDSLTFNLFSTSSAATTIAGNSGNFTLTQPLTNSTNVLLINATITPQGRLTLASDTPVMTASQAEITTVYYTPYAGNLVPIYDGTNFIPTAFSEVSQTTADTTKSPAAVAANSVYDIFCWVDSSTPRCTRGPAWSTLNVRSAGTAMTFVNGIALNTNAITNGPGASRGTYVGSICSDASSQINYVFGAASNGGTPSNLCVWNAYNRVATATTVTDNGASYSYATATIRQARLSAGNQIGMLIGLIQDAVSVDYVTVMHTLVNSSTIPSVGIGLNSTTTFADAQGAGVTAGVTGVAGLIMYSTMSDHYVGYPGLGVQVFSGNELGSGANAATMDNNSNNRLSAVIHN